MSEPSINLVCVGNALVDVLTHCSEEFIKEQEKNGVIKGSMMLIDKDRAEELYSAMPKTIEISGGSAANTITAFASFGGKGAYIGKVAKDELGEVFINDMKSMGVTYNTQPLIIGETTGRCLIMVTPDAQRTMNTYLGAATELHPADIDADLITSAKVTYLEGYLFDPPHAKEAFFKAGEICESAGHRLALSLSDPFCVNRHREDFHKLIDKHVNLLFGNEEEIISLCEKDTLEEAIEIIKGKCEIIAITRSEKGSIILKGDEIIKIDAIKPKKLVDTTGAGDAYAAGFLYGFTEGKSLEESGKLASIAASEIISHMGPKPETNLAEFAKKFI